MRGLYFGNPLCALNNDNPPSSSLPSDINFFASAKYCVTSFFCKSNNF